MNNYKAVSMLKVRTTTGVKELGPGEMITLPEHMAGPLLAQGRIKPIIPCLDTDGSLVIPFNCDPRYHWWSGGQLPSETEKEVWTWKH